MWIVLKNPGASVQMCPMWGIGAEPRDPAPFDHDYLRPLLIEVSIRNVHRSWTDCKNGAVTSAIGALA